MRVLRRPGRGPLSGTHPNCATVESDDNALGNPHLRGRGVQRDHGPVDPCGRDDLVADLDRVLELLHLLASPTVGEDEEGEQEERKEEDDERAGAAAVGHARTL